MSTTRYLINSKFRACLLGGLLGDCLGSSFEGEKVVGRGILNNYFYNLLSDGTSNRNLQIYPYTDDTAMMKSVAASLLQHKGFEAKDMAQRFAKEYIKEPRRGYGANAKDLFLEWNDSDFQDVLEPATYSFNGCGSLGNGAAMRVSPVSLFSYATKMSKKDMVDLVRQSSQLTHAHPYGYNGAILQALSIRTALETSLKSGEVLNISSFLDSLISDMKPIEEDTPEPITAKSRPGDRIRKENIIQPSSSTTKTPYTDKLMEIKGILEDQTQGSDLSAEEIVVVFGNSVSALRSVPAALYCALRSIKGDISDYSSENPLLRCLYLSISLGGDTDTIACMACSIVGSFYGEEVIQSILKKRCEFNQETTDIADQLSSLWTE